MFVTGSPRCGQRVGRTISKEASGTAKPVTTSSSMFAAILSLLVLAQPQTASPLHSPPSASAAADLAVEPDVTISVRARADEVKWRQVGSVVVRAWSEPDGLVIEENLTTGLPRPIPGQRTFRNVDWNLLAGACLRPAPSPTEEGDRSNPTGPCDRSIQTNTEAGDTPR